MSKIQTFEGSVSNIEKIMKYCSQLGDIFDYPYYFNWSTPTNYRDRSPIGEIDDASYAIFRVGKYLNNSHSSTLDRVSVIEKQVMFGSIHKITSHFWLQCLVEDKNIVLDSLESIKENLDMLKEKIDIFVEKD